MEKNNWKRLAKIIPDIPNENQVGNEAAQDKAILLANMKVYIYSASAIDSS